MEKTAFEKRIDALLPSLGATKDDKWWKEREEQEKKAEFERWQRKCGLDADFYGASIDTSDQETKETLLKFVESVKNQKGNFLILLGKVGTGKTYSAAAVMNALGFGTYLDIPELELKLNTADRYGAQETREDVMHRLAQCKLLVLDEIGRFPHKRQTEQDVLFYLLNKRYQNKRQTILCSNLTAEEFAQHLGEALIDRIRSRRVRVELNGKSKR